MMAPAATHTLAILHRLGELKKKKEYTGLGERSGEGRGRNWRGGSGGWI